MLCYITIEGTSQDEIPCMGQLLRDRNSHIGSYVLGAYIAGGAERVDAGGRFPAPPAPRLHHPRLHRHRLRNLGQGEGQEGEAPPP